MVNTKKRDKEEDFKKLSAETLARYVQEGSKISFTELVKRFGPRLYNYFYPKVQNREDCEDLVQDTLVKAYKNIHLYNHNRTFTTWLFTIGTRKLVDHFRTLNRMRITDIPHDLPGGGDPYEAASRQEDKNNIWSLARTLPGKQYHALWFRYAEDMPIKEIARVLGINGMHVKVLLYRARAHLAKQKTLKRIAQKYPENKKTLKEILSY